MKFRSSFGVPSEHWEFGTWRIDKERGGDLGVLFILLLYIYVSSKNMTRQRNEIEKRKKKDVD
jgi:hypothetical protein